MKVLGLFVYPIKSCAAVAVREHRVLGTGLELDRQWMVVQDGRFVTQRDVPALALIRVAWDESALTVVLPGGGVLRLAFEPPGNAPLVNVQVWKDSVKAYDLGDEVAAAITSAVGKAKMQSLRLVQFGPSSKRVISHVAATGSKTKFADGFPFLVTSTASLEFLNDFLAERGLSRVPMDRFRANIVVGPDGVPFEEDRVEIIAVGPCRFRLVRSCTRCPVITTDQVTAAVHAKGEPLRALGILRKSQALPHVTFGQNAVLLEGEGEVLRVGDAVKFQSYKSK